MGAAPPHLYVNPSSISNVVMMTCLHHDPLLVKICLGSLFDVTKHVQPEDLSTPEQREMVRTILAKKDDLYAVLSLPRSAGDDEIKKAYRKLALKLHPDKNKAHGADEAFKVVSKAFSCLSDSDKRARYDRYGEETPGLSRTASGRPMHGEFDADEIFNAFFGGRPGPIFRTHFGGPFQRAGPEGNGQTQSPLLGLVTIAPIVLFLLFTFLSSHSDPVFTLDRTGSFVYELQTSKLNVPFFVKSVPDLDKSYPSTSVYRLRLEREVEGAYQERLSQRCYKEQVEQRRLYQWGYLTQAKGMALPSCKEFTERFGHRTSQYGYAV